MSPAWSSWIVRSNNYNNFFWAPEGQYFVWWHEIDRIFRVHFASHLPSQWRRSHLRCALRWVMHDQRQQVPWHGVLRASKVHFDEFHTSITPVIKARDFAQGPYIWTAKSKNPAWNAATNWSNTSSARSVGKGQKMTNVFGLFVFVSFTTASQKDEHFMLTHVEWDPSSRPQNFYGDFYGAVFLDGFHEVCLGP